MTKLRFKQECAERTSRLMIAVQSVFQMLVHKLTCRAFFSRVGALTRVHVAEGDARAQSKGKGSAGLVSVRVNNLHLDDACFDHTSLGAHTSLSRPVSAHARNSLKQVLVIYVRLASSPPATTITCLSRPTIHLKPPHAREKLADSVNTSKDSSSEGVCTREL